MYASINGTGYGVRPDSMKGGTIQIGSRDVVLDGSLVVRRRATREWRTLEFIKDENGVPLTITTANALRAILEADDVDLAGDCGTFTADARDIGIQDITGAGGTRRFVTATLEETEV